jgi:hypothetical protein
MAKTILPDWFRETKYCCKRKRANYEKQTKRITEVLWGFKQQILNTDLNIIITFSVIYRLQ